MIEIDSIPLSAGLRLTVCRDAMGSRQGVRLLLTAGGQPRARMFVPGDIVDRVVAAIETAARGDSSRADADAAWQEMTK